jgi:hypothetical protein
VTPTVTLYPLGEDGTDGDGTGEDGTGEDGTGEDRQAKAGGRDRPGIASEASRPDPPRNVQTLPSSWTGAALEIPKRAPGTGP